MTNQYKHRMTKKILSELPLYRTAIEYNSSLSVLEDLPARKVRIVKSRLKRMSYLLDTVEEAMSLLTPMEREVLDLHYNKEHPFSAMEEILHLERSSVYRYHAMAVDKIATVLYGD